MNNSKRLFSLLLFTTFYFIYTYAGGSSYSRYGIGDILHYGDSRLYAMSGTGIALIDNDFINGLNPAGLARISYTRFSGGFEYYRFISKDENGSGIYSLGKPQSLAFAIPVSKGNGIVLSLEATPYSMVNYTTKISIYDSSIGVIQTGTYYGSGGLSYLALGMSVSPSEVFHIGARINYMYGRIRQYQKSDFNDPTYSSTIFDRSNYYSGFTFTFGTIYEGLYNLLDIPFLHNLTIGLTATTSASIDVDEKKIFPDIAYQMADSIITQHGTADLPLRFGLGISYLYSDKYRFLGDIVYENWDKSKFLNNVQTELRDSYRASVGFEIVPLKGADSYWKRIYYRLGFAYDASYYKIHNTGINELLLSGGLGLPLGHESRLNLGLQIGMRGSTDNKLQKDTIIRLSIAISASELWFQKFEEE